jgi:hypothetical protein
MKDPFKRWAWYVIQVLLFLLLLSTCGKLLKIEMEGWTSTGPASGDVTVTRIPGIK